MQRLISILWPLFLLTSCASPQNQLGMQDLDELSQAHPAAYRADAMTLRTPMPSRPKENWEFYYKHCSNIGEGNFISKTSYECSTP